MRYVSRDGLFIRGLRVSCRIGVPDEERARPQTIILDIDAERDLTAASASDELADTLDYGTLTSAVAGVAEKTETRLLEHMAELVAECVLGFRGIERVTVSVAKEKAPIPEEVEAVGIRIVRPSP